MNASLPDVLGPTLTYVRTRSWCSCGYGASRSPTNRPAVHASAQVLRDRNGHVVRPKHRSTDMSHLGGARGAAGKGPSRRADVGDNHPIEVTSDLAAIIRVLLDAMPVRGPSRGGARPRVPAWMGHESLGWYSNMDRR